MKQSDIDFEGKKARRLFWEMCASNAINILPNNEENESVYQNWRDHKKFYDYAEFVASFADSLLDEWDKRWIAGSINLSERALSLLDAVRRLSLKEDEQTRDPSREPHITLYSFGCKRYYRTYFYGQRKIVRA